MKLHDIETAQPDENRVLLAWFQRIFEDRYSFEIRDDRVWERKLGEDEFHQGKTTVDAWIRIMKLTEGMP